MTRRTPTRRSALALILVLALMTLQAAAATAACTESQEKEADFAFSQAADFVASQNWTQAIPQLQSALAICPEHVKSLKVLGKAYYATGDFDNARKTFEKLVEVRGKDAEANDYMDLGKTYAKLKEYRLARQAYVNASRIDPDNCLIQFNLAVMHGAVKDYARAVEAYEHVLDNCSELSDKVLPALTKACTAAAAREKSFGNLKEAALYAKKAADYGSQAGGSAGYNLIVQKMHVKDYAGAADLCDAFLQNNPDSSRRDNVLLNLARCRVELKQNDKALDAYKQYLDLKPSDGQAADEMIELLAKAKRCDEALAAADAAVARVKDDAQKVYVVFGQGKALECAGRYSEAKEKFRWVAQNASGDYRRWSQQEMTRMDQLEEIRQRKRQNAGY